MGNKFKKYLLNSEITSADITKENKIDEAIKKHKSEVIINCAGKTGKPNIDWCETHQIETFASNVLGPLKLSFAAKEFGIYLVHLSSGCIYEGDNEGKGFSEEDLPNFRGSYYSRTKILAEEHLKDSDVLQLRLRMPIDEDLGERSLVSKLLKYDKIISVPNSLTVVEDLLFAAKQLMDKNRVGIYNIVNPGIITHQEIMDLYKEIINPSLKYEIFSLEEMLKITKAGRSNCILNSQKLENEGIKLPEIHLSLRELFEKYLRNHSQSSQGNKGL